MLIPTIQYGACKPSSASFSPREQGTFGLSVLIQPFIFFSHISFLGHLGAGAHLL